MPEQQLELFDVTEFHALSKPEVRELISRLEETLKDGEQIEVPIQHHFSKGVYAREMSLPKGSIVVGKIHKFQSLNILSQGEVSVYSQDGYIRVKAPYTFVSSPGAKRVIVAHEDIVWTTIHGTDEKDVEKIEDEFIAKTYEELPFVELEAKGESCLG